MPLTPADVADRMFGRQVRGYAVAEVDAFLDEVEGELRRLLSERAELLQRAETAAAPEPGADGAEQAWSVPVRTLQMAERTAAGTVAAAQQEAEQLLATARAKAAEREQEAQERAEQVLADLHEQVQALQAQISALQAFERDLLSRLRAYLQAQLRDLGEREDRRVAPGTSPLPS